MILEKSVDLSANELQTPDLIPNIMGTDELDQWKCPGTKDLESQRDKVLFAAHSFDVATRYKRRVSD